MKKLLIIFLFHFSLMSYSQDYLPFRLGWTYQYEDTLEKKLIHVKVIKKANDVNLNHIYSFAKFNYNVDKLNTGYYDGSFEHSSFFGFEFKVSKDLNKVDFYTPTDTLSLFIDFKINPDRIWNLSSKTGVSCYFQGLTFENHAGLIDSVLTIKCSNNQRIKISKNYGFVEAFRFLDDATTFSYTKSSFYKNLHLDAIKEFDNGNYILSFLNIYNFNVGDKYVRKVTEYPFYYNTTPRLEGWVITPKDSYFLEEVVSKQVSNNKDTIFYELKSDFFNKIEKVAVTSSQYYLTGSRNTVGSEAKVLIESIKDSSLLYTLSSPDGDPYTRSIPFYENNRYGVVLTNLSTWGYLRRFEKKLGWTSSQIVRPDVGMRTPPLEQKVVTICYSNSNQIDQNCELPSGFEETNSLMNSILIFPNPTKEFISLKNVPEGNFKAKLYDSQGKLVLEGELSTENNQLNVNSLEKGLYYFVLSKNEKTVTHKLVIE